MPGKNLSPQYLSEFCAELAMLVRAGITVSDGVSTLAVDFDDASGFLSSLSGSCEGGASLGDGLSQTGRVPGYMLDMIRLGERTGR